MQMATTNFEQVSGVELANQITGLALYDTSFESIMLVHSEGQASARHVYSTLDSMQCLRNKCIRTKTVTG